MLTTVLSNEEFFRNVTPMTGQELPLKDHHLTAESLHCVFHACTNNARRNSDTVREQAIVHAPEHLKLCYTALVTN